MTTTEASFLPAGGTLREYAAAYVALGWSVIPIKPQDKRPLIAWEPNQTERATMADVDGWLSKWPSMNLAVATGAISGIIVLDLDGEIGLRSLRESGRAAPKTLLQKTPHGWHCIYQANGHVIRNAAGVLPKVDIRGDGGYIVVPPSTLADGAYRWHYRLAPVPVPDWLESPPETPEVPTAVEAHQAAPRWIRETLERGVGKGERNATATRLAGYFQSRGIGDDVILTLLRPFAARCQPAIAEAELVEVVRSVSRYAVNAKLLGVDDPPHRITVGDGHRFEWDGVGIKMDVTGIRSDRDGLSCELTVESAIPGTARRLYGPVRFNLLSLSTRTNLCTSLTRRVEVIDWPRLVDDMCRLAVETHRAGAPLVLLRDAVEPPAAGWLIPPLLMHDGPTMWFATGASAKSLMALVAAYTISSEIDIGIGGATMHRRRVAFLDWEWEAWRHKRRLRSLVGDEAMARCDILHRRCTGPLVEQAADLRRYLVGEGVDFIVVDSVVPACGGEPEISAPVRDFFDAIRGLHVGSLLIAHNNKLGDEEHPYGNIFWFNESRCIWYVGKRQESAEPGHLHIGMYNRKSNDGPLCDPIGFHFAFSTDGSVTVEREDIMQQPGLAERVPVPLRLLHLLQGQHLTTAEIAVALEITEHSARTQLARGAARMWFASEEILGSKRVLWTAIKAVESRA